MKQGDGGTNSQIEPAKKAGLDWSAAVVRIQRVSVVIASMYWVFRRERDKDEAAHGVRDLPANVFFFFFQQEA